MASTETHHPFFPALPLHRTSTGAIPLTPSIRPLLPSPSSRHAILTFLGFAPATVDEILRVYNHGRVIMSPLTGREMRLYPLASALLRVWEASHVWVEAEGGRVEFAVRNGLREEFARDVDWRGREPEEAVRRYLRRNVDLLKGLWVQERLEEGVF